MTKIEVVQNQIKLIEELQNTGFNVVSCGNCGSIMIHRTSDTHLDCLCGIKMELCDCPDLWYKGSDASSYDIRLVTVYYNDVFVSVSKPNEAYEVYEGCPYVKLDIRVADKIASEKVDNHEWESYLIPELIKDREVIFHGE